MRTSSIITAVSLRPLAPHHASSLHSHTPRPSSTPPVATSGQRRVVPRRSPPYLSRCSSASCRLSFSALSPICLKWPRDCPSKLPRSSKSLRFPSRCRFLRKSTQTRTAFSGPATFSKLSLILAWWLTLLLSNLATRTVLRAPVINGPPFLIRTAVRSQFSAFARRYVHSAAHANPLYSFDKSRLCAEHWHGPQPQLGLCFQTRLRHGTQFHRRAPFRT